MELLDPERAQRNGTKGWLAAITPEPRANASRQLRLPATPCTERVAPPSHLMYVRGRGTEQRAFFARPAPILGCAARATGRRAQWRRRRASHGFAALRFH